MLTLFTPGSSRDCRAVTRRNFIQVGTLGIGGLTLPGLLAARASAAAAGSPVTDKSVVLLCLVGGASHIETFDPKMSAPAEYRSTTGAVATSIPGVAIGGGFPLLARRAHRLAIVRSYRHGKSNHGGGLACVLSGDNKLNASMGSIYARLAGASHPRSGLPNYSVITSQAVHSENFRNKSWTKTIESAGSLGKAYDPFYPIAGPVVDNMQLSIEQKRLTDRRGLLAELDKWKHRVETDDLIRRSDKFQQQALDVILRGAGKAFDLSREDPRVVARYRTAPSRLGEQMLLARRVVEAGAGFVTVTCGGWDMHGKLPQQMKSRGAALDRAVATFLDDLHQRGLHENVLLVITGDFGRTPRVNRNAGRDHWGNLCTLAFAGGGYKMGQVIGKSDDRAAHPVDGQIGNPELTATIMHSLIDIAKLPQQKNLPPALTRFLAAGAPIQQLL